MRDRYFKNNEFINIKKNPRTWTEDSGPSDGSWRKRNWSCWACRPSSLVERQMGRNGWTKLSGIRWISPSQCVYYVWFS